MSGFTPADRKMLTDTYREVGEVKTDIKHITKRLDKKDNWFIGMSTVAVAAFLNWFK